MLKFQVAGRIVEARELKTSKEKGERVWRRLWKVSYDGGAVDVCFGTEPHDLGLYNGAKVGDEVNVSGHVNQDKMGSSFVYGGHVVVTVDDKALAAMLAAGIKEDQARAILAKAAKGAA